MKVSDVFETKTANMAFDPNMVQAAMYARNVQNQGGMYRRPTRQQYYTGQVRRPNRFAGDYEQRGWLSKGLMGTGALLGGGMAWNTMKQHGVRNQIMNDAAKGLTGDAARAAKQQAASGAAAKIHEAGGARKFLNTPAMNAAPKSNMARLARYGLNARNLGLAGLGAFGLGLLA